MSARPGHHLEGGVGDVLGELVADHQLLAALELHEPEEVRVLGRQVARESVLGLVEVVVGVEDREVKRRGLTRGAAGRCVMIQSKHIYIYLLVPPVETGGSPRNEPRDRWTRIAAASARC